MAVQYKFETAPIYRAALELQQYLSTTIPRRRGLGHVRSQLERAGLRALLAVAESSARADPDAAKRLLETAAASCVRLIALLSAESGRDLIPPDVLLRARALTDRLAAIVGGPPITMPEESQASAPALDLDATPEAPVTSEPANQSAMSTETTLAGGASPPPEPPDEPPVDDEVQTLASGTTPFKYAAPTAAMSNAG